jgi:hypothetical protein
MNVPKPYPINKVEKHNYVSQFSPARIISNSKDAPHFKLDLIDGIREGVNKKDWIQLLQFTDCTEKEFENILHASHKQRAEKCGI